MVTQEHPTQKHANQGNATQGYNRTVPRPRPWTLAVPLLLALLTAAGPALGAGSEFLLTYKRVILNGDGDSISGKWKAEHGNPLGGRDMRPGMVELEYRFFHQDKAGTALTLELSDFSHTFRLVDPTLVLPSETVNLKARLLLYSFKGYTRWGSVLPFFSLGSGAYYVTYSEQTTGNKFLASAPQVFSMRAGFHWMWGSLGMAAEAGYLYASVPVITRPDRASLELGGTWAAWGVTWVW
ncbi:MAG: hypothetical protein OEV94_11460 [Deltaproteobacteria bacterium]|nr:hypothetical protein [Deltaproteobacteria bacterium]